MSKTNPTTVEELLAMPTADIAAMTDAELEAWARPFFPATRPAKITQNALARESTRLMTEAAGSGKIAEMLAAAKAKRAAAVVKVNIKPTAL
jgi:hypothetical protein